MKALRTTFLLLLFMCNAAAHPQNFDLSNKRYKTKFKFELDPGEKVIRTWFHFVVTATADGKWVARTFYPETGQLTDLTTFADERCTKRSGRTEHWYDDGSEVYRGQFEGDKKVGVWLELSDSGRYDMGEREGVWKLSMRQSGKDRGPYKKGLRDGTWIHTDSLGRRISERQFKQDRLEGAWIGYSALTGEEEQRFVYSSDSLVEGDRERMSTVEHMPYLKHCKHHTTDQRRGYCTDSLLMVNLRTYLKYPTEAQDMQVTGKALINFVVQSDGRVTEIEAMNGLCAAIAKESLRVMQKMSEWEPGVQSGKAVAVQYQQPIKFTLR